MNLAYISLLRKTEWAEEESRCDRKNKTAGMENNGVGEDNSDKEQFICTTVKLAMIS